MELLYDSQSNNSADYYCYRMIVNLLGVYDYLGSQEEIIFKK